MNQHIITAIAYFVLSAGLTVALIWAERKTPAQWGAMLHDMLTDKGVAFFLTGLFWARLYGWLFNAFIFACAIDHLASNLLGHGSAFVDAFATIEAIISAVTAVLFVCVPAVYLARVKWKV